MGSMDTFIMNELKGIKEQLKEINEKLDNLSYLSEMEEISSALRKLSPASQRKFIKPKPKK